MCQVSCGKVFYIPNVRKTEDNVVLKISPYMSSFLFLGKDFKNQNLPGHIITKYQKFTPEVFHNVLKHSKQLGDISNFNDNTTKVN